MEWLELLRLFAEDQNRANAESNRQAILNLQKGLDSLLKILQWTEPLQFLLISVGILWLYFIHQKVKKLKNFEKK